MNDECLHRALNSETEKMSERSALYVPINVTTNFLGLSRNAALMPVCFYFVFFVYVWICSVFSSLLSRQTHAEFVE